jgi:hypothetical protein
MRDTSKVNYIGFEAVENVIEELGDKWKAFTTPESLFYK